MNKSEKDGRDNSISTAPDYSEADAIEVESSEINNISNLASSCKHKYESLSDTELISRLNLLRTVTSNLSSKGVLKSSLSPSRKLRTDTVIKSPLHSSVVASDTFTENCHHTSSVAPKALSSLSNKEKD